MIKIFGEDIDKREFVWRLLAGIVVLFISLAVLFVPPWWALSLRGLVPPINSIESIVAQVLSPVVPITGVLVSIMAFSSIILRRSRIEGLLLIGLGLVTFVYFYILMGGGFSIVKITPELLDIGNFNEVPVLLSVSLTINSTTLLIISAVMSLLIIAKGVMLILFDKRANASTR